MRLSDALIGAMLLTAWVVASDAREAPGSSAPSRANDRALLVACTHYEHLSKDLWLEGPKNDAPLMKQLLSESFRFAPDNIRVLSDWPDDARQRPTRENIRRELQRLVDGATPGSHVVIWLSGHGSQQPADDDPKDEELDGLDEIFLPADVRDWNPKIGKVGGVENAVTDDEIRTWLEKIRAGGASVWFIADACHSGSLARGGNERPRRVLPDQFKILGAALARRYSSADREESTLGLDRGAGGLVALYAAHPGQMTPELTFPDSGKEFHGLLTYTLIGLLRQQAVPLTYRELALALDKQYQAQGRPSPSPLLEGGDIDREVLGLSEWPDRPQLRLGAKEETTGLRRVAAGRLAGITQGTVLAVFPPAGNKDADKSVGHVRVVRLTPTQAWVEPYAYAGVDAPKSERLTEESRCRIEFVDFGDIHLRVALQSAPSTSKPDARIRTFSRGSGPPMLEKLLSSIETEPAGLIRRVDVAETADWFIRKEGDRVILVPSFGWLRELGSAAMDVPAPFVMGTISDESPLKESLPSALRRIARARGLLRLALERPSSESSDNAIRVKVEVLRSKGAESVPIGDTVEPGTKILFRATNEGTFPVDLNVLFVDSGYGISVKCPTTDITNRLHPGDKPLRIPLKIDADTLGVERLVTIATRASGSFPLDLRRFAQSSLVLERGTQSPLVQLLDSVMYGIGATRGVSSKDALDYRVDLQSWTVVSPAGATRAKASANTPQTPNSTDRKKNR